MTDCKTNLNKLKRTEIIWNVSSDHTGIKLEINNRKISGKSPSMKLNILFLKQGFTM